LIDMLKKLLFLLTACLLAAPQLSNAAGRGLVSPIFVTIGSGDFSGVYFPTGLAIARAVNRDRRQLGIRATVESTRGSVFNVNAVVAGYLEFGLVQSDKQYHAFNGLEEWAQKGPQKDLRAVFSLHHETVSLVASVDSGIETIADLEGKRVNLGNPGSGQYRNAIDALTAAGIDPESDIEAQRAVAAVAPDLLQDGRIDAFFCTLGHPSETLVKATSGARKVRFISIDGPGIDDMLASKAYYTRAAIPVAGFYPGAEGPGEVKSFGVTATLCTSSKVPDIVVYKITKEVFENLEDFKQQHPALADLTPQRMLTGLTAPLHPGALMYFRQAGLMK
jgi:TRAP transporter TAXI family solute receptor